MGMCDNQFVAGVGKSATIDVISMQAEKALREKGNKLKHPRVLLLAHTGKAASLIGKVALIDPTCKKILISSLLRWYYTSWSLRFQIRERNCPI